MELEHTTVKELKLFDSIVREQPLETDISLPEYYPAIGRLLRSFVIPSEEAVTFADGRVSVAGTAEVRLLYADDENKLHCYRTETKYTKILQTDVRNDHSVVRVTQDVRTLNCRALGPKRAEIKASIAVRADLLGILQTDVICSAGPDLQLRSEERKYTEPVCLYNREFTVHDILRCEAGGRQLRTVVSVTSVPVLEKTEIVSNKVMLRGKNSVTVICADEEGHLDSYELFIPFNEILDCSGVGDNMTCHVTFLRCAAETALEDEEHNTFDVSVRNQLLLSASQQKELTCVTDAYSLQDKAECRFAELSPASSVAQTLEEASISAELEAFDDGAYTISSVFISEISCVAPDTNGGAVEGSLCFNAVIADGEKRPAMLTKTVSFSRPIPEGSRCLACGIAVKNASGKAVGGKVNVSCTLSYYLLIQTGERLHLLTEVKAGEGNGTARQERAVVYFAEKGESLWSIAKENRTSVANIKTFNSLSSDVIETDTRLVFPCL